MLIAVFGILIFVMMFLVGFVDIEKLNRRTK